ncbi:VOC family protein [Bacillus benzoevorans]|uniref:Catechol 2,3-dioxygenase n=1 Tax=Bacillus benzoevorans TaxID=1456 RepID=A0A7X0HTN6_9BACI|nr:VOC family protein [Bacillus benzoevorans]MBB6445386.1 catechol 2,3-dioxygenase [Bacillus benzoevorans]
MSINTYKEPNFDVAQLAHVEILSPNPEETVQFFTSFLGLEETARDGQSVYLRAYEDLYHHSLKVTEHKEAGLGHIAWRTASPQSLQRRSVAIQAAGLGRGWTDGDIGHGRAYQFTTPDGHMMELLWDIEYSCSHDLHKKPLHTVSKRPNRGVPANRLNHVHLMDTDPGRTTHFMQEVLGFRLREQMVDKGIIVESSLSVSDIFQEIAVMKESTGRKGKLHHLSYWYHTPQNLYELAALLKENEIYIEAQPNKHGISETFCMFVYEPGGNRIELLGDVSGMIYDPAWQPIVWDKTEMSRTRHNLMAASLPDSYWSYGTPATLSHPVKTY